MGRHLPRSLHGYIVSAADYRMVWKNFPGTENPFSQASSPSEVLSDGGMGMQAIKAPGCPLLNSFDSDSFGTVTISQRSTSECEAMNDTMRTKCALGRTAFS